MVVARYMTYCHTCILIIALLKANKIDLVLPRKIPKILTSSYI